MIKDIVRKHLPSTEYKAFLFGSRVAGNHRKFSDVDLGILGNKPIPSDVFFNLQQDLEDSDIPYIVELLDFSSVAESFKSKALTNTIPL